MMYGMMGGGGWGGGGWVIGLLALFFGVLVIAGIILLVRYLWPPERGERADSALAILRERYARGEINQEEFEQRKKDLR